MMDFTGLQCPIPISEYPTITMAHGGGGRLTQMLIERMFVPTFANQSLEALHDGAILPLPSTSPNASLEQGTQDPRLAFTTDSFVITPRFFPGGDIGSLAVHGTVNDLAMCGARPLALSASFILEEGLRMDELWRIVQSMQAAAQAAGVTIVTGDTKVVDRGRGDGIYINTAGLGIIPSGIKISPSGTPRRSGSHQRPHRHARHRRDVGTRGLGVRDDSGERRRVLAQPGFTYLGRGWQCSPRAS
jgi:hydrogenase expression/formation protein HypE